MGLYWGYIGIMERKMEATILWGCISRNFEKPPERSKPTQGDGPGLPVMEFGV